MAKWISHDKMIEKEVGERQNKDDCNFIWESPRSMINSRNIGFTDVGVFRIAGIF